MAPIITLRLLFVRQMWWRHSSFTASATWSLVVPVRAYVTMWGYIDAYAGSIA